MPTTQRGLSFNGTMQHLQNASRNVADGHLHQQIRKSETLPTARQVNCGQQFDTFLEGNCAENSAKRDQTMTGEIISFKEPRALAGLAAKLPAVFLPDDKAACRFLGFFHGEHPQQEHAPGVLQGGVPALGVVRGQGTADLAQVKPPHGATNVEMLGAPEPQRQGLSKPTVKQHLAALRMLFDWPAVGHVLDTNPAHAVRDPKFSQKKGRTPVLDREEARAAHRGDGYLVSPRSSLANSLPSLANQIRPDSQDSYTAEPDDASIW